MSARSLFPPEPCKPFRFDADPTGERTPRQTMAAKVAEFFKSRPGEWIDGREVMTIAGAYGWRTRISDCRDAPYFLDIKNRQRRVGRHTVSEYRLVVPRLDASDEDAVGGAA